MNKSKLYADFLKGVSAPPVVEYREWTDQPHPLFWLIVTSLIAFFLGALCLWLIYR